MWTRTGAHYSWLESFPRSYLLLVSFSCIIPHCILWIIPKSCKGNLDFNDNNKKKNLFVLDYWVLKPPFKKMSATKLCMRISNKFSFYSSVAWHVLRCGQIKRRTFPSNWLSFLLIRWLTIRRWCCIFK